MVSFDWLDRDPDDLERLLIAEGRRDKPPAASRRRTLATVTVAAAAGATVAATSASATAAVTGALPWLAVTKWVAVGVAAGAVTLGAAEKVQQRASTRAHATYPIEVKPPVAAPPPPRSEEPPDEAPSLPAEVPIEPTVEAPAVRTARPSPARAQEPANAIVEIAPPAAPAPSAAASDPSSLEGEVRLLEEARRALDAHAGSKAIRALDRYERDFPSGLMSIEARALRIEALVALGQRNAARAFARSFLANHPRSPAAMRVTRLLEAIDSGEVKP